MTRRTGFSIVEIMVAILIVAVGLGGILSLFTQMARTASRSGDLATLEAAGRGVLVAEGTRLAQGVRDAASQGATAFPATAETIAWLPEDQEAISWQARWEGTPPAEGPIPVTLHLSTDWNDPAQAVRIEAAL